MTHHTAHSITRCRDAAPIYRYALIVNKRNYTSAQRRTCLGHSRSRGAGRSTSFAPEAARGSSANTAHARGPNSRFNGVAPVQEDGVDNLLRNAVVALDDDSVRAWRAPLAIFDDDSVRAWRAPLAIFWRDSPHVHEKEKADNDNKNCGRFIEWRTTEHNHTRRNNRAGHIAHSSQQPHSRGSCCTRPASTRVLRPLLHRRRRRR
jgi:hypothetical protein